MRRANWVLAVVCVAVVGASVAEAKGPRRIWHKSAKSKSAKSTKAYGSFHAPAPLYDVHEVPEMIVPEEMPPMPMIESSLDDPRTARLQNRARWIDRRRMDAERQPNAMAVPVPTEAPLRLSRAWSGRATSNRDATRLTTPEAVQPSRPIAGRFESRRQAAGPAFPNDAPLFQPNGEQSVMSNVR